MEEIRIRIEERDDLELEEIDVSVEDSTIDFDVSGRIHGVDETALGRLAGQQFRPIELRLEAAEG